MASIREYIGKNGEKSFNVMVRVKGCDHKSKSFSDYETALIWGKYYEMISKEMEHFNAKPQDLYTIQDILAAKYGENGREFKECIDYFRTYLSTYLRDFNYDKMMNHAKELLNTPVYRGGKRGTETGKKKLPEPTTVLRKYAYLSSAINTLIKKGEVMDNEAAKVVTRLREVEKEHKRKK